MKRLISNNLVSIKNEIPSVFLPPKNDIIKNKYGKKRVFSYVLLDSVCSSTILETDLCKGHIENFAASERNIK